MSHRPPNVNIPDPDESERGPKRFRGTPKDDDDVSIESTSVATFQGMQSTKKFMATRPRNESTNETVRWVVDNPCKTNEVLHLVVENPEKHEKSIKDATIVVKMSTFQQGEFRNNITEIDTQLMEKEGELDTLQCQCNEINNRLLVKTQEVNDLKKEQEGVQKNLEFVQQQEREARFRVALSEFILGMPPNEGPFSNLPMARIREIMGLTSTAVVQDMNEHQVHHCILLLERFKYQHNPVFHQLWAPQEGFDLDKWVATYGPMPALYTGKVKKDFMKMKNRLCDYLQIPGEDLTEDRPPPSVGVPLETVPEEMSEEELQAKIRSLEAALQDKKRRRSSG